jgi:hypothetical protein
LLSNEFLYFSVPPNINLRIAEYVFLNNIGCPKFAFADKNGNMIGKFREEQAFLCRTVSSTDNSDSFTFVKRSITGSAKVNTGSKIIFLSSNIEAFVTAPRSNEQGAGAVLAPVGRFYTVITVFAVYPDNLLGLKQLHTETFCLLAQSGKPGMLSSFSVPAAWPPNAARSITSVSIASRAV